MSSGIARNGTPAREERRHRNLVGCIENCRGDPTGHHRRAGERQARVARLVDGAEVEAEQPVEIERRGHSRDALGVEQGVLDRKCH